MRAEVGGEFFRGELLAAAIEQDEERGDSAGLGGEPVEEGWLGVEELGCGGCVAGGAGGVVGDESFEGVGLGAGAAGEDGGEGDRHGVMSSMVRRRAVECLPC